MFDPTVGSSGVVTLLNIMYFLEGLLLCWSVLCVIKNRNSGKHQIILSILTAVLFLSFMIGLALGSIILIVGIFGFLFLPAYFITWAILTASKESN